MLYEDNSRKYSCLKNLYYASKFKFLRMTHNINKNKCHFVEEHNFFDMKQKCLPQCFHFIWWVNHIIFFVEKHFSLAVYIFSERINENIFIVLVPRINYIFTPIQVCSNKICRNSFSNFRQRDAFFNIKKLMLCRLDIFKKLFQKEKFNQ